MYQPHWGLRDDPFRNCVDPGRFFRTAAADEALARLHFLVDGGWRLALLLGTGGSGKSMLVEVFRAESQAKAAQVARIAVGGMESQEVLWELAGALRLCPAPQETPARLWRLVADRLVENRYQRIATVIVFDATAAASERVWEQIERLLASHANAESRLSIVVTGEPSQLGQLARLLPLVDLRVDLPAWTKQETLDYLEIVTRKAGAKRSIFEAAAAERVHALARGVPRRINQLAAMALLAGAADELPQIDAATVDAIDRAFGLPVVHSLAG